MNFANESLRLQAYTYELKSLLFPDGLMFSICKEKEHNFQKHQNIALLYLNLRKNITQFFNRALQERSSRKMQTVVFSLFWSPNLYHGPSHS